MDRQTDGRARAERDAETCPDRHVKPNLHMSLSPQVDITYVYNTGGVTATPEFGHLCYLCV